MDEKQFSERLARLRTYQEVSARDMSLSIGQNPGYISNIENGKNLPGMRSFFYICDFLHMTPAEFFDDRKEDPKLIRRINSTLYRMDRTNLEYLAQFLENTVRRRS